MKRAILSGALALVIVLAGFPAAASAQTFSQYRSCGYMYVGATARSIPVSSSSRGTLKAQVPGAVAYRYYRLNQRASATAVSRYAHSGYTYTSGPFFAFTGSSWCGS